MHLFFLRFAETFFFLSAPGELALLPRVRLQEGHLRHVRQEDDERQELQAEQPVVTNAVWFIDLWFSCGLRQGIL